MNSNVINQVIILTLMMIIGVILRKTRVITNEVNKCFSRLLMNLTMPFMIIYSFNIKFSMDMLKNAILVTIYSFLIHLILIILSKVLYFKFPESKKNIMKYATVFSNCGFVGYPVLQGLYGKMGVFYTSIYSIPFNIFMWSYGVMLFTGKKDLKSIKKNIINAPMISIFLGIIMFVFSIKLPAPILSTLGSIGNMTTPLSMFIIGAMLADVKFTEIFKGFDIYYVNFIKLIASPLISYAFLKLIGAPKQLINMCVILVAMPTATLIGVFAERYNGNKKDASKCAFLTTILSLITIPIIISIIQ